MSGHNRWAKIKHKKGKTDAVRGKLYSTLIKEITVAAKEGGGDPDSNASLRTVLQKAKDANMPNDTMNKAVKRGTGELEGVDYIEIRYEGYGPGGVAMIVDVLTDNKNRAISEVRYTFDRYHGKLAATGAVAWKFDRKAVIEINKECAGEDDLMMVVLDAGAEDLKDDGDIWTVVGPPETLEDITKALEENDIAKESAEVTMVPQDTVNLEGDDAKKMLRLIEKFEELDDVKNVYANFDVDDSVMEAMED
jgi:YebC/PmpR family DNA-binding regulatory protein